MGHYSSSTLTPTMRYCSFPTDTNDGALFLLPTDTNDGALFLLH
ncbi:unnamed protein product [Staurois parvus]|uniref:Uncharacterized protein n=1 Tax=Staurois parvus TaxID=386267 RepID=A0ABN9FI60_9NEOB|nr:unnamed protein product [Staurois parvus]